MRKKKYFEGWFQKIYSHEHHVSFILIYGMATGHSADKKGFIQLHIPNQEHTIYTFNESDVAFSSHEHRVEFGENVFSENRIYLHAADVQLDLDITNLQPKNIRRNTMGGYYFIPNLPCYHAVVNEVQEVSGEIHFNRGSYTIRGAKGYLEKNWGTSFPEEYLWMHAFDSHNSSNQLLFSLANVKWMGRTYTKHVGYLKFNDIRIDLLQKSFIQVDRPTETHQRIRISNTKVTLEITVKLLDGIHFKAPEKGVLQRSIMHHNDVFFHVRLSMGSFTHDIEMTGNYENMGF
jgi:hypothetical protein